MTTDDMALVREYAESNSESAFVTLVSRHVNLVYSVALRQVGNPHLAEEITQGVFIILASKAKTLGPETILPGWLCRTARYVCADTLKTNRRRQLREHEAHMQSTLLEPELSAWTQIAPLLDQALNDLDEKEHDAVVLRFFDGKELKQIGSVMGVTEDAARMRVNRGLEKLRDFFTRQGVTLSTTAIAGAIATNAVQAAPLGLAAAIAGGAFSGATLTTAAAIAATKTIAMTTLQKTLIATAFAVAAGLGIFEARQVSKLRAERIDLVQELANAEARGAALSNKLAVVPPQSVATNTGQDELLRLRGEVSRLRLQMASSPFSTNSVHAYASDWLARVDQLQDYLRTHPEKSIPEISLMSDREWLSAADAGLGHPRFETEDEYWRAVQSLYFQAEATFANKVQSALIAYAKQNPSAPPEDIFALAPFTTPDVMSVLAALYKLKDGAQLPEAAVQHLKMNRPGTYKRPEKIITRKSPAVQGSSQRCAIFADGNVFWQAED